MLTHLLLCLRVSPRVNGIQLSEQHGVDTYLHFIRRLIVHSNSKLSSTASPASFDASPNLTFRLLVQEVQRLSRDPFLADRFRDGVDKGEGDAFRNFDFPRFLERVALRPLERLVLASSIVSALTRRELAMQAVGVVRMEFENAVLALCQHPSFDHADLSPNQVAKLMSNLLCENPTNSPILDATQRQALILAAQTKYGPEIILPILQRLLPTLQYVEAQCLCLHGLTCKTLRLSPNATLVQALIQLGPDITSELEVTRGLLTRFDISEANSPEDEQVVDMFSQLARIAAEGSVSCDIGTLVHAVSSLVSAVKRIRECLC